MRITYCIAFLCLLVHASFGQQKVIIHNSGNKMYAKELSAVDSIKLDNNYARFKPSDSTNTLNIQKKLIDSVTFTTGTVSLDKIYIIYNGTDNATIINPYAAAGVSITANAGAVVVTATSGLVNLEYDILGSSANGSLTMATDKDVKLVLNNLALTNPNGAAFSIAGGKTTQLLLTAGTTNTLADGSSSTKNGTITTDGPITIDNSGSLAISGVKRHGINTSSTITILNGTTTISSAASDGFHSEGYAMSGGTATIASLADGIDAGNGAITISGGTINVTSTATDVKAIKTGTGALAINAGTFNLNVSGAQSKAISARTITLNNGTFGITISGATVLAASGSGYDPSYATAVKSDSVIVINGGTFNIQCLAGADGGRGFSANKDITIAGGNITVTTAGNGGKYVNVNGVADSYSTSAFSTNASIIVYGGTVSTTNSGADGKGFSADGNVAVSGTANLTINNSGSSGKGIKADGAVSFGGGTTTMNLSGETVLAASGKGFDPSYPAGVKAGTGIVVNSGTVTVVAAASASGARGLSSNTFIAVNGGNVSVTTAGNGAVYTNTLGTTDSYAAAAFSSDTYITVNGGTVTTNSSGTGGKGLKADGAITIGTSTANPTLNITTTGVRFLVSGTDYNHPKTIVANGAVTINNGNNTINSTDDGIHSDTLVSINGGNNIVNAISTVTAMGEGVEAPTISFTGGVTNITASNDGINATYGTVPGGTESNDNSNLYISGGIIIVAGKDAIDCNGNLTITGGTTIVTGPTSQPEEGIDFNGTFLMHGGLIISGGANSNMTKNFGTASTQRSMFIKSGTQLAATSVLHIENAAGTEMVTYRPKNAVNYFHFSSPGLAAGTQYKVYFGGTYTGGGFVGNSSGWGLYTGGTYSNAGATLKSTFTTSGTSTVNTVTF